MVSDIVIYFNFGKKFIDSKLLDKWYEDINKLLLRKNGKRILEACKQILELCEDNNFMEVKEILENNRDINSEIENLLSKYGFNLQAIKNHISSFEEENENN